MEDFLTDMRVTDTMHLLMLVVGDIRYMLKTVAGLETRPTAVGCPTSLGFYVNDVDNEVISRDIVLLDIIKSIDPADISDIEYL